MHRNLLWIHVHMIDLHNWRLDRFHRYCSGLPLGHRICVLVIDIPTSIMSPISSLKYSTYSNGIIIASSDSVEATTRQIDNSSDPPSPLLNGVKRSNSHFSSYTSTSRSQRAKKRRAQRKPAMDSSKVKDDPQDIDDYLSVYQLPSQFLLSHVQG